LLDEGIVTIIAAPGATVETVPLGINNEGQVVGLYADDTRRHGLVYSNGEFTTFTAPGAFLEAGPFDIDDGGCIVGFYF
jgi:probable HAF family extracellular repeat protein